jgi:hypothetical protein
MAVAEAFLGREASPLDSHLFGRREINIPPLPFFEILAGSHDLL